MPWATAGVLKNAQFGPDGIMYYDVVNGRGRSIQCGDRVAAHIDVFANGIEVDTTRDGQGLAARPKAWDLCTEGTGPGAALRGLDLGVRGMRVGGKRVIDVPPELAYGNRGRGPLIPPNTPLRIKVTMLSAKKWGTNPNVSPPGSSVY
jgi:FKBP-type peptidyl-prolyl cis-trans isomerase